MEVTMDEDLGGIASDPKVAVALAAVRRRGGAVVLEPARLDEVARSAYGNEVRAGLLAGYGVSTPRRLDRVIAEAAVARLSADVCVEVIAEAFDLRRLPERRY